MQSELGVLTYLFPLSLSLLEEEKVEFLVCFIYFFPP